jgi:hypothetical protein
MRKQQMSPAPVHRNTVSHMLHSETKSKDVVVRKVNSRAKQLKDRKYLKEVNVK